MIPAFQYSVNLAAFNYSKISFNFTPSLSTLIMQQN